MRYPPLCSAVKVIACAAMVLVGARSVLAAALDGYQFPLPEPQHPIPGSGSGGAWGPSEVHLSDLPQVDPEVAAKQPPAPLPWVDLDLPTLPPPKRLVYEDEDTVTVANESKLFGDPETVLGTVTHSYSSAGLGSRASVTSSFTDFGRLDVNGASDGTRIVTVNGDRDGVLQIYTLTGTKLHSVAIRDLFCGGANPLPVCALPEDSYVDPRVIYDTLSQRWTIVLLVTRPGFNGPWVSQNVFAVSQSSDPTGSYYRYQYPACGAFDNWDRSDQPRIGFNNQWIVITSACQVKPGSQNPNDNGAGLAVFIKGLLYNGWALQLNTTWFQFVDWFSGGPYVGDDPDELDSANNSRDTPTLTHVALEDNRMFLVSSVAVPPANETPAFIYSWIQGPANAPVYIPDVIASGIPASVSGQQGALIPAVSAPGCANCMQSWSNAWVHSASVYGPAWNNAYVVSTAVWGDRDIPNSTQIIAQALWAPSGGRKSLVVRAGVSGSGPMAAEIARPFVSPGYNQALIVYDHSRESFFPGVRSITWDIDFNTVVAVDTLLQGSFTPSSGYRARWEDWISAISPIPGTGSFVVGGTLAAPSLNEPQRTTYWGVVNP